MSTTMKLIAKASLGADAASIDITSIPGTYTDLVVLLSARSARGGGNATDDLTMAINTVTTNRTARRLYGNGSSALSDSHSTGFSGTLPADVTANTFGNVEIYFPNYAGSTNKSFSVSGVTENNATNAQAFALAGLWSSTAAITGLTFSAASANLRSGSSVQIYGITKA